MSESKCFEELFCSLHVWTFFFKKGGVWLIPNFLRNFSAWFLKKIQGGGVYFIPKLLRNFFACVRKFFRKGGGGLPNSKNFEELFCLCFLGDRGGST